MLRIFICKVCALPNCELWIISHMNSRIWQGYFVIGILILILLLGCAPQKIATSTAGQAEHVESKVEASGVPNFDGIVGALTCVFAPDHCGKKSEKSTVTAPKSQ